MDATAAIAVAVALIVTCVIGLIPLGFRLGDRPEEAQVAELEPQDQPRGALVTIINPGHAPVIFGLSIRTRSLRVRTAGSYVRLARTSVQSKLLPTAQGAIGVVGPRAREEILVTADSSVGRKAELVATIGQSTRLRVSHRQITLPPGGRAELRGAPGAFRD